MFSTIQKHPKYEVSKTGIVRRKGSIKPLKTYDINGHPKVMLDGKTEYVSRIVAETFIENKNNLSDVKHVDGNKENNMADNLTWTTHSDTQQATYNYYGALAPGGNENAKEIIIKETGEIFPSIRSCARAIHGSPSGIRQQLNGKLKTYKGHIFMLRKDL